jgi:hypothetical protein
MSLRDLAALEPEEDVSRGPRDVSANAGGRVPVGSWTDPSQSAAGHVATSSETERVAGAPCAWCGDPIPAASPFGRSKRIDTAFCKAVCRKTAWRLAQRGIARGVNIRPMRVGYADPPYPGCAWRYYRSTEVDHAELVALLVRDFPDGWALSTSAKSLRDVLPLCPATARVCAWAKPHPAHVQSMGLHNTWEPLIVVGGRALRPGVRDVLSALPARGGGELPGRKPIAFVAWLFSCLGVLPGDELEDLFPGTGVVGRAFRAIAARPMAPPPPSEDPPGERGAPRG